jgi:hypothetical protein
MGGYISFNCGYQYIEHTPGKLKASATYSRQVIEACENDRAEN